MLLCLSCLVALRGSELAFVTRWGGGGGGKAYWVNTKQVAELYGVWMLIKEIIRRKIPQVSMLQDNLQAIWGTVNVKSRAHFWRHNRVLRAMILHLKNSGLILHSVWVPMHTSLLIPCPRYHIFPNTRFCVRATKPRCAGMTSFRICIIWRIKESRLWLRRHWMLAFLSVCLFFC